MWDSVRKPLFALSIGLNLAFVVIWMAHSYPGRESRREAPGVPAGAVAVPSALHRKIGVTEEQWERIAPHVREFRERAATQRRELSSLRRRLLDLLIVSKADEAAIRSKQAEILAGQRQMQNLVIDHLLEEKELLSPEQGKRLIQAIRKQCFRDSNTSSGKGIGRYLNEMSGEGALDQEKQD